MINTYFDMLIDIGLESNELVSIQLSKGTRFKKGFLYDIADPSNKEDYLAMYVSEEGKKILFPKYLRFPEYVDRINFGRYEGFQSAYFNIQFPDSSNEDEDVIFIKFPIKDVYIWLLVKDVDYSFPIDNCIYGFFEVQFNNAIKQLNSIKNKSERIVRPYQKRLSLLLYPGSFSEKPMFRDYKVVCSPKMPSQQVNRQNIKYLHQNKESDYYPNREKKLIPLPDFTRNDNDIEIENESTKHSSILKRSTDNSSRNVKFREPTPPTPDNTKTLIKRKNKILIIDLNE